MAPNITSSVVGVRGLESGEKGRLKSQKKESFREVENN